MCENLNRALKDPLEKDEFTIRTKIETIEKLVEERKRATSSLLKLSEFIPEEVWIKSLTVTDRQVAIAGTSIDFDQVTTFINSINNNQVFAKYQPFKLISTNKSENREMGISIASFNVVATTKQKKRKR